MASLMAFFMVPTTAHGGRLSVCIISRPFTGGWKLRMLSRRSKSVSFRRTTAKLCINSLRRRMFLEVMSASHNVMRSSMSLPASKSSLRTAESVTMSEAMAMGRICKLTSFRTYRISSPKGRCMRRNMSATMCAPTALWLWNVHPLTGS